MRLCKITGSICSIALHPLLLLGWRVTRSSDPLIHSGVSDSDPYCHLMFYCSLWCLPGYSSLLSDCPYPDQMPSWTYGSCHSSQLTYKDTFSLWSSLNQSSFFFFLPWFNCSLEPYRKILIESAFILLPQEWGSFLFSIITGNETNPGWFWHWLEIATEINRYWSISWRLSSFNVSDYWISLNSVVCSSRFGLS